MLHKINKFCFAMTAWVSAIASILAVCVHAHWLAIMAAALCFTTIMIDTQYQVWLKNKEKENVDKI